MARDQCWDRLVAWYLAHRRTLPWRDAPTPYRVWVSEVMLQQTQVATVIPYFERWMTRFPTVEALAEASEPEVLKLWAGLGYYRRAKSLREGAKQLVRNGHVSWPDGVEAWLEVPGVGRYTAGAIASIALNRAAPIVDGNVERVLARLRRLPRDLKRVWSLSEDAIKRASSQGLAPRDFNQALMELGATICTPKDPRCSICPIRRDCEAYRADQVSLFPRPKARRATRSIRERVLVCVDRSGHVLLVQSEGMWRKGLWDFPKRNEVQSYVGEAIGSQTLKYSVTHHRVARTYTIVLTKKNQLKTVLRREATKWVPLWRDPPALGAPAAKIWTQLGPMWPNRLKTARPRSE